MPPVACHCRRCRLHLSEQSPLHEGPPVTRGRARRSSPTAQAAWRFGRSLASLGFDVRAHFIDRWAERAIGRGVRAGPAMLAGWFAQGRHFRDTRRNQNVSFAVTPIGVIVYRLGGPRGDRVVLITLVGALPPGAMPRRAPRLAGGRVIG